MLVVGVLVESFLGLEGLSAVIARKLITLFSLRLLLGILLVILGGGKHFLRMLWSLPMVAQLVIGLVDSLANFTLVYLGRCLRGVVVSCCLTFATLFLLLSRLLGLTIATVRTILVLSCLPLLFGLALLVRTVIALLLLSASVLLCCSRGLLRLFLRLLFLVCLLLVVSGRIHVLSKSFVISHDLATNLAGALLGVTSRRLVSS